MPVEKQPQAFICHTMCFCVRFVWTWLMISLGLVWIGLLQVTMLADGGAQFTKATGLQFETGNFGGLRMQRMSMLVRHSVSHCYDSRLDTRKEGHDFGRERRALDFSIRSLCLLLQVDDGVVKKLHLEGGGGFASSAAEVLLEEM